MPRAVPLSLLVATALLSAQDLPRFDAVSVKPASGGPVKITSDPGRITMTSIFLDTVIRLAYNLREYQYKGPAWAHVTRYDIVATTTNPQPRPVELAMLRAVLEDRFHLATHRAPTPMPVYALTAAKGGPKLRHLDAAVPTPFDLYYDVKLESVPGGATQFHAAGSIGLLCDFLARIAGRPVIDETGLEGAFEFRLLCAIDGYPGEETSPTVFDALPAQMGLRLEARTAPVEVTVVDRLEKPSEN